MTNANQTKTTGNEDLATVESAETPKLYRIPEPALIDLTKEEWAARERNLLKGRTGVNFDDLLQ